ncbi:hypothetical protein AB0J21_18745 [Streptomyces sp. NPDC049954]|uniref:hypothetical protein n=1 Tax=Streptomyces sp. NPDC049954 TaxID=3155779 RepID=UPI0034356C50
MSRTRTGAWWGEQRDRARARRAAGGHEGRRGRGAPAGPDAAGDDLRTLAQDLPDEDIADDLDDQLDCYHLGSKPRCEEVEYLRLVEDARDRMG